MHKRRRKNIPQVVAAAESDVTRKSPNQCAFIGVCLRSLRVRYDSYWRVNHQDFTKQSQTVDAYYIDWVRPPDHNKKAKHTKALLPDETRDGMTSRARFVESRHSKK